MSRDDCLRAHNEKRWIYFDKVFIGLQVNGTFRQSVTIRGTKHADGTREGASFSFRGTSYDKSVLEQDMEITLFSQTGKVDVQTNQIILPGGASCNYKSLGCQDDCGVLARTGLGRSGSRLSWPLPRTIGSVRVGSGPLQFFSLRRHRLAVLLLSLGG